MEVEKRIREEKRLQILAQKNLGKTERRLEKLEEQQLMIRKGKADRKFLVVFKGKKRVPVRKIREFLKAVVRKNRY